MLPPAVAHGRTRADRLATWRLSVSSWGSRYPRRCTMGDGEWRFWLEKHPSMEDVPCSSAMFDYLRVIHYVCIYIYSYTYIYIQYIYIYDPCYFISISDLFRCTQDRRRPLFSCFAERADARKTFGAWVAALSRWGQTAPTTPPDPGDPQK